MGPYDVLINNPEHNTNHNIYHKKILLKKTYMKKNFKQKI